MPDCVKAIRMMLTFCVTISTCHSRLLFEEVVVGLGRLVGEPVVKGVG